MIHHWRMVEHTFRGGCSGAARQARRSLKLGRINNSYFWIDPARSIAGVILLHNPPFVDSKALGVHDVFERAVYQR